MRALLGMVLFSMVGCDSLWASYIGMGDFGADSGSTCSSTTGCDLASPTGDLATATPADLSVPDLDPGHPPCPTTGMCPGAVPFCDQNTGTCTADALSADAYPLLPFPGFETAMTFTNQYTLMATGDYNSDGLTDVALSGSFVGVGNSTGANAANVDIYLGNGAGGFTKDATSCVIPMSDAPVYLLTVPGVAPNNKTNDLLVATLGPRVYYCSRGAGWPTAAVVGNRSVPTGFKQLALAMDQGQTNPDLIIRNGKFLFLDPMDPSPQGSVDVHRTNGSYVFSDDPSQASSSGLTWVTPIRLKGGTGDSLGISWDDTGNMTMGRRGVEFYYTNSPMFATNTLGYSAPVYAANPVYFPELKKPFRATSLLHLTGQNPGLLLTLSQTPNIIGVLAGNNVPSFNVQTSITWGPGGLMMPFTGDMNVDGQDEIGIYSLALNASPLTRHLQLLSYKNSTIGTVPIADITSDTENFRAMALEFTGSLTDRRRLAHRKDLITLVETPGGGSRLRIVHANLNYAYP